MLSFIDSYVVLLAYLGLFMFCLWVIFVGLDRLTRPRPTRWEKQRAKMLRWRKGH